MYTLTAILIMVSLLTGGAIAMLIMIAVRFRAWAKAGDVGFAVMRLVGVQ